PPLLGEIGQAVDLLRSQGDRAGERGGPRVARRAIELGEERALPQLPAESMLAPSSAHHQHLHAALPRSAGTADSAVFAPRALTAMTSTMSSVEQPRDRSLIGRASPWRRGPTARAPPRRSVS